MRIVFWQNMLAIHQSAHIRALAASGHDVTLVVQEKLDTERQAQGWSVPDFGRAKIVVDPDDRTIEELIQEKPEDSTHIFTTIRAYPVVKKAFLRCVSTQARMGLLVESQDFRGWKGQARLLRTWIDSVFYARRLSLILAMGNMGVRWFCRCGFPPAKVFPYGYFVEKPSESRSLPRTDGPVQLMYLGQFVPRKGVDTLLQSLGTLTEYEWRLTLMGTGPAKAQLEQMAAQLNLSERIKFVSAQSNQEAVAQISRHDLFILPSRFDGWGAVVNEALMCGVPVVCSDHCGAAELLEEAWRGEAFQTGSVQSLTQVLHRWITKGKCSDQERERIRRWSRCIEGDVAADYLLQAIQSTIAHSPPPLPPWRQPTSESATDAGALHSAKSCP